MTNLVWVDVTVPNSGTSSPYSQLSGLGVDGEFALCAVALPATVDGTVAGIEWSFDAITAYAPLASDGSSLTFTIASAASSKNGLVMLDPVHFSVALPYFRVTNGTAATANRTYKLGFRKV